MYYIADKYQKFKKKLYNTNFYNPEGLPAVVTIMLSLGVQRMAKKNAVVRKLPAVETLGSATYICSDKTGTLTQNRMTVTELALPDGKTASMLIKQKDVQNSSDFQHNLKKTQSKLSAMSLTEYTEETASVSFPDSALLPPGSNQLLTAAMLCNNAVPEAEISKKVKKIKKIETNAVLEANSLPSISGEPTEQALLLAALLSGINYGKIQVSYPRVREIPFDSVRKRMTTIHKTSDGSYISITKGAFDLLLPHCSSFLQNGRPEPLTESIKNRLKRQNERLTSQALRVIAVAGKKINKSPFHQTADDLEHGLTFLGLLGMIDPPRPEVKDAVVLCRCAGITPVMITGDHAATATAIAKELGILPETSVKSLSNSTDSRTITGEELNRLSQSELEEQIYKYRVFARVSPEHKVRIVKALQKRGEIVAMTGDGVNDAPALKAADIGCVMGLTGTDVAKNASDMILMDDNFATIVSAVKEGRGIYDNIRKSIHFLLSSNIGEIITIFTAILFKLPAPLAAVQLLWVNLVTDSLPAIALGMEPPAKDIMNRPPVSPKKGMFANGLVFKIIFEGAMIGFLALIAYIIGGRTCCFAVLSLSQLFHAFNMRSEHSIKTIGLRSNPKMLLSFFTCAFLQVIVISFPPLAAIFQIEPLSPAKWLLVGILSFLPIPIIELQKKTSFYKK